MLSVGLRAWSQPCDERPRQTDEAPRERDPKRAGAKIGEADGARWHHPLGGLQSGCKRHDAAQRQERSRRRRQNEERQKAEGAGVPKEVGICALPRPRKRGLVEKGEGDDRHGHCAGRCGVYYG